jgi:hypothetical protein
MFPMPTARNFLTLFDRVIRLSQQHITRGRDRQHRELLSAIIQGNQSEHRRRA